MSYQVLARKWRPKSFTELMGQEHVVTVLVNALEQQRLHHAYLFTGTRGVGKTTIARIFAKSLNCLDGVSAHPCGKCDACVDIDQGRFVDLIEIDAASRTKVDDTREILDNVQYAPSRGRYKVYLIDEVHMLSRHSFNALLKTLEEPPAHVKFILATTDPQKLPVTVLSRCLQFHLKALTVNQIEQQLQRVLTAENVSFEDNSLNLLAKAARGSMRDSLSLTDQSIAQGQGHITVANVQQMLGGVDQHWVYKLLIALIKNDGQQLMANSLEMASYSPNYSGLLAEFLELLHQVALYQVVGSHFNLSAEHGALVEKFAKAMSAEDVQLYYQILLNGRKDLPYASDEQAAFDMVLLRLLAFKPINNANELPQASQIQPQEVDFEHNLPQSNITSTTLSNDNSAAITKEENEQVQISSLSPQETDVIAAEPHVSENTAQVHVNETDLAQEMAAIEESAAALSATVRSDEHKPLQQATVPKEIVSEEVALKEITPENVTPETMPPATPDIESNEMLPEGLVSEKIASEDIASAQASQTIVNTEEAAPAQMLEVAPTEFTDNPIPIHEQPQPNYGQSDQENTETQEPVMAEQQHNGATQELSPVEIALASRNMLRSRKKEAEGSTKKSKDAAQRQQETAPEVAVKKPRPDIPAIETVPEQSFTPDIIDPAKIKAANQVDRWANMIDSMALGGRLRQLAIHATVCENSTDDVLSLALDQATKHLKTETAHKQLEIELSQYLNRKIKVDITIVEQTVADPYQIQSHINDKRYDYAKEVLLNDEIVQAFFQNFQAELDEKTVSAR